MYIHIQLASCQLSAISYQHACGVGESVCMLLARFYKYKIAVKNRREIITANSILRYTQTIQTGSERCYAYETYETITSSIKAAS